MTSSALANPQGGQVVQGQAAISQQGSKLDIHQQSNRAVIDWRSFDIEKSEHTQFHQPSSNAVVLNRVNAANPSKINGKLSANGNVVIVNPNGVFFGADSKVDVNGLIATTADIDNDKFMKGNLTFDKPGKADAAIVNNGSITAKEAGLVGLVAPNVINNGVINAKLGKVQLASGDSMSVDLYGDGLMGVKVSDAVKSQIVANTGTIAAEGGSIQLTAAAGKNIVNSLISVEGELRAPTIKQQGGKIIIAAEGRNAVKNNVTTDKGTKQGRSHVEVKAVIDASGRDEGEQGGSITITGDEVALRDGTLIDASGYSSTEASIAGSSATVTASREVRSEADFLASLQRAGGSIKIGGDYLGKGDTPTAAQLLVEQFVLILNDAISFGDAGRTTLWSDRDTAFNGTVLARGGKEGGDGGFVETSGKINLSANGYVDLTPRHSSGAKGVYLLDPTNITIYGNETSVFNNADLVGFWDFNEGAGVTSIDRETNQNGTISNGTYTTGINGSGGLDFNGTNTTVSLGNMNSGGTGGLTISGWFNADDFDSSDARIISKSSGSAVADHYWMLSTVSSGGDMRLRFRLKTGGATTTLIASSGNLSAGTLYHAAATYDGTNMKLFLNGVEVGSTAKTGNVNTDGTVPAYIGFNHNYNAYFDGMIDDVAVFDSAVTGNALSELSGNRFTADGIEFMSKTADVVLQATNDITLDLGGDTMTLTDDRSLTLNTTNGDITTASTGTIITNRTGTGGNITFNAGGTGDIDINHALTLRANNGGVITLNTDAGRTIQSDGNLTLVADTLSIDDDLTGGFIWRSDAAAPSATFDSGGDGFIFEPLTSTKTLGVGTGTGPDIVLSDALITEIKADFSNYTFGRSDGAAVTNNVTSWEDPVTYLTNGNFTNAAALTSDDTILVKAGGDVIISQDIATTSATANALVLSAGDDFLNSAGSDALSATNSRWIVYSDEPANNTRDGLMPTATEFNKTYAANDPTTIGANNRFVYATATQPTLVYEVGDDSVTYGSAYAGTPTLTYSSGLVGDDAIGAISLTGAGTTGTTYSTGDSAGVKTNALTGAIGTLATPLGYLFSFTAGDLTVNAKTLTAALTGAITKTFDGTTTATLAAGNYNLTGIYNADDVSLDNNTAGTYDTAAVGAGKTITVNGLTLTGAAAANYVLASNSVSGAIGAITAVPSGGGGGGGGSNPIVPILPDFDRPSTDTDTETDTGSDSGETGSSGGGSSSGGSSGSGGDNASGNNGGSQSGSNGNGAVVIGTDGGGVPATVEFITSHPETVVSDAWNASVNASSASGKQYDTNYFFQWDNIKGRDVASSDAEAGQNQGDAGEQSGEMSDVKATKVKTRAPRSFSMLGDLLTVSPALASLLNMEN